jgi:flagellin-like protein
MSTKKMLKSRKAISPILATLLLIVIAVAAIVVTYAWIMTYMGSAGQQAGVRLYKTNVRFYIQSSIKKVDIDVQNTGTSDTQIIQVYAGASPSTLENQTTTQTLPLFLGAGLSVRVTINYNWTNGGACYLKVVSSSGQILEWVEQVQAS